VEEGAHTVRFGLCRGDWISRVMWCGPLHRDRGARSSSGCIKSEPSILIHGLLPHTGSGCNIGRQISIVRLCCIHAFSAK
jgi:hypothetical protein